MKKVQTIKNIEGILLHSKEAGNGNRIVFIFTKNYGNQTAFISQSTIKSFGSGLLMPFTYLRCSMAETSFDKWTLIQYEGKNICDISKFSYEDWCRISSWRKRYKCIHQTCQMFKRNFGQKQASIGLYNCITNVVCGRL